MNEFELPFEELISPELQTEGGEVLYTFQSAEILKNKGQGSKSLDTNPSHLPNHFPAAQYFYPPKPLFLVTANARHSVYLRGHTLELTQ